MPPRIEVVMGEGADARPLGGAAMRALRRVEVRQRADAAATFRLSFAASVAGADLDILAQASARPFARLAIRVGLQRLGGEAGPVLLIDGVVTEQDYDAPLREGAGTLTIGGEDMSVRMDMVERSTEYPALADGSIVERILGRYDALVEPVVIPPDVDVAPTLHVPQQNGTDLAYLRHLARRHGAVFRIEAGTGGKPAAYWGPPKKAVPTVHALTVGAGAFCNVESLSFRRRMLAPSVAYGAVLDVATSPPTRVAIAVGAAAHVAGYAAEPMLSDGDALAANPEGYADKLDALALRGTIAPDLGPDATRAQATAQGLVDATAAAAVTATGTLDTTVYGALLVVPGAVEVRGAGQTFDGTYAIAEAAHIVEWADGDARYTQEFALAREGVGATGSTVAP